MRNKRKIQHAKDGTERGQKGPAGLALFGAQSISVFFSTKYVSTLICVLPKPPTISAYKYLEADVNREEVQRDRRERVSEIHSSWTQEKGDTGGLIVPRRRCKLEDSKGSIPCRRFHHHDRLRFA